MVKSAAVKQLYGWTSNSLDLSSPMDSFWPTRNCPKNMLTKLQTSAVLWMVLGLMESMLSKLQTLVVQWTISNKHIIMACHYLSLEGLILLCTHCFGVYTLCPVQGLDRKGWCRSIHITASCKDLQVLAYATCLTAECLCLGAIVHRIYTHTLDMSPVSQKFSE